MEICTDEKSGCFGVEPMLFGKEFLFGLPPIRIIYTTINRANGGALWLFVKPGTFRTLIRYNIVVLIGNRRLLVSALNYCSIGEFHPGKLGPAAPGPIHSSFVNCGIGTLRFACTTIDAFVRDDNGHFFCCFFETTKVRLQKLYFEQEFFSIENFAK
jgi:hypothetical protein